MRYWIAVASRQHVLRGVKGGFAQVCHGKPGPLKQMCEGDWIAYYSPTEVMGQKDPCRRFTALGHVGAKEPYQVAMSEDFIPWRRDVDFVPVSEAPIEPLLSELSFVPDSTRWGLPFRRGCFAVDKADFQRIAAAMGVKVP